MEEISTYGPKHPEFRKNVVALMELIPESAFVALYGTTYIGYKSSGDEGSDSDDDSIDAASSDSDEMYHTTII